MIRLQQPSPVKATALVVKIGGSLLPRIPDLVPLLLASERPLLIVPGGGMFADTVRQADVDDDAAHWMAIAAMEQYGWLLSSKGGIGVTGQLAVPHNTTVFLPYKCLRENDPLPHSWDITSDSIAAWIAGMLHLDLLLLKSIDGITIGGRLQEMISEPLKTEVVDPFFIPFVLKNKIHTAIIKGSDPVRVQDFLKGLPVPGTTIGTTF
jgi:5-(aminomethyl)-3-furanmethanol phosphate kinase